MLYYMIIMECLMYYFIFNITLKECNPISVFNEYFYNYL